MKLATIQGVVQDWKLFKEAFFERHKENFSRT